MKKSDIDAIVIHCSATPEGKKLTLEDIDRMHRVEKGWKMVGYNYVIELDGKIRVGRPLTMDGAHCKTEGFSGKPYNKHSIGICYIGGVESTWKDGELVAKLNAKGKPIAKDTRTTAQKKALVKLVYELIDKYPNIKEVIGHRDTSPDKDGDGFVNRYEWIKECPCFEVRAEFPMSICKAKRK